VRPEPLLTTRTTRMKREFNVIVEKDSAGYYGATVPALHVCNTQAKSSTP